MKFDLANFADNYLPEDPHQSSAREKGEELGELDATPGSGAFLKYIASLISAQSVVEIGTGSGVGTLWLLKGVINSGVITTIDPEVQHIQVARQVLNEADIAPNRYRLITSDYIDVMRKLADRAYDRYGYFVQSGAGHKRFNTGQATPGAIRKILRVALRRSQATASDRPILEGPTQDL